MRTRRATVKLANPAEKMASFAPVAKNDIAGRDATAFFGDTHPQYHGATIPMPFGAR